MKTKTHNGVPMYAITVHLRESPTLIKVNGSCNVSDGILYVQWYHGKRGYGFALTSVKYWTRDIIEVDYD